jgi:type IV secretory pathway ATPase VirB11/archaellum biosynthesis ATPase
MPDKKEMSREYEIISEGQEQIMRIKYANSSENPSIEDSAICMARTVDKLSEVPSISRIIFNQRRNYTYDYEQTQMLVEIANIYNHLVKQKKFLSYIIGTAPDCDKCYAIRYQMMQYIILNLLRADPLGAYVECKRLLREENIRLKNEQVEKCIPCRQLYIDMLSYIFTILAKTKLISLAKPNLEGYVMGDRSLYREYFRAIVTPDFMFTRLMAQQPLDGEELDVYSIGENTDITIFKIPGDIKYLYHINPPEFKLNEDHYELLDLGRTVLAEHKPREEEFLDPEKIRTTFMNIGRDLLQELAQNKGIDISYQELEELAKILIRYTIGFGLIEVLLQDPKIQDITVNSPIGETPIYIVHQDYDDCVTNIIPSKDDALSWASKFRMLSGRPLDEANPVLDTELIVPQARARVAIITNPLSPIGLAYALRRHRDQPWTLPLFIKNRMINPLSAGLISFLIDGSRTMLIAGTRSSGKTSLLAACMVEIMRKYRVITLEDTLELPVNSLRNLGYNIQPMKVRSALMLGGAEIAADEGIRTSLRMGDSSLIVGEVRSLEAKALYEAMRIGALANVVAGTIHGASPYGVFDRVVNDLQVPRTSFKATDIIIVANPIKSPDGLHKWRRVVQIAEVRKNWEEDPLREKGFVDLMTYNPNTDSLEPSDELINGESEILKTIAGNVKEWVGNWDAIWENILLRAKIKEKLIEYSNKLNLNELLEAKFVIASNDKFHEISESVREDVGFLENKRIFFEWEDWLKKQIKKEKEVLI